MSSGPRSLQLIGSKGLGGAERWFLRFVRALAEQGADTHLGLRAGSALDGLECGPLPCYRLPFRTVWDPFSRSAVTRLIRRLRPDIVQTYMGRATRLTRLGRPGSRPVHIARLGGYYALPPYRHAHALIGNTKGLCDWLVSHGIPANRVYHLANFVEPAQPVSAGELAALRARLGIPDEAWVLLAAGRFVAVKGLTHLLAALDYLPAAIAGRPWCLVLLGAGPLELTLRRQARELEGKARICWAGWHTRPGAFFQLADLVVFPSLEEETLGNVILEAWAWSKPLVVSRFRGAREITHHGKDAWCVPCADPEALARGIATVLGEADLAAELARAGFARVSGEFSRTSILAQYRELYAHLAAGGGDR